MPRHRVMFAGRGHHPANGTTRRALGVWASSVVGGSVRGRAPGWVHMRETGTVCSAGRHNTHAPDEGRSLLHGATRMCEVCGAVVAVGDDCRSSWGRGRA